MARGDRGRRDGAGAAHRKPARTGRAGTGYDLHRLVAGRPLILGGVTIPSIAARSGTPTPTSSATR